MAYYYSPFRKQYNAPSAPKPACPFCDEGVRGEQSVRDSAGRIIENKHAYWVINWFPKCEGHTMVVPKRHILSLEEETPEEMISRGKLIVHAAKTLRTLYPGAGIEIFLQTGAGSLSSIPHLHWHVIPSLSTDTLRGFDKMGHFHTTEEGKEKVVLFPIEIRLAQTSLQEALAKILK